MPTILDKWNEIKPYMFGRKTHGESSTGQTEIWSGHANGLMVEVLVRMYEQLNRTVLQFRLTPTNGQYIRAFCRAMINPFDRKFMKIPILYGTPKYLSVSLVCLSPNMAAKNNRDTGYGYLLDTECNAEAIGKRLVAPLVKQVSDSAREMDDLVDELLRTERTCSHEWDVDMFLNVSLVESDIYLVRKEEEPCHKSTPSQEIQSTSSPA